MAAGGYKEFVAGEILDQDDINDYLMQGVLVFAGTAARGSAITAPVEGQFAWLNDSDSLTYYSGSAWEELSTTPNPAVVSATTGSPTLGTAGGYEYYAFTGDGSITFSDDGFCDVLLLGGGGSGGRGNASRVGGGGGAGGLFSVDNFYVSAGTVVVEVGAGGVSVTAASTGGNRGGDSYLTNLGVLGVGGGGGGGGGLDSAAPMYGHNGGSGGGGGSQIGPGPGGKGVETQGKNGGDTTALGTSGGGGGGGAGVVGSNATTTGGAGGNGLSTFSTWGNAVLLGQNITGTRWFAGGGGGGSLNTPGGAGGNGGGGAGNFDANNATAGSASTGGGGGGSETGNSGAGGSGLVIVRVLV
jgi:hypothetical protein